MKKIVIATSLLACVAFAGSYDKCATCHGANGEKAALGKSKIIKDLTKAENPQRLRKNVDYKLLAKLINFFSENKISEKELFSKTKKALGIASKTLSAELEKLKLNKRHSLIKVDDFNRDINELFTKFEGELDTLKSSQQHLSKADSLKERLESLFELKVGNAPKDQKEVDDLYKEAENRYKNKIPPGYLDNDKNDICVDSNLIYKKKYGDFLVWRQLLSYTRENEIKQVVFITNDLKEDWWSKFDASGEKFNQPRPELIDEALHVGGIDDFIMYDSEKFLSSSLHYLNVEVSDNAVQEVRDTIEMYNKDMEKSNFDKMKEERHLSFEKLKQKIALEKVKEFQSKINYLIYRNGGIAEFPTDVLTCPECGLDTMIFDESSSTGYKCTYCKNEESDEIEIQCTMCGSMWPNSEIAHIEWTDEGHIEKVCPFCRHDPDYVGDD
jgi:hypothetical protein